MAVMSRALRHYPSKPRASGSIPVLGFSTFLQFLENFQTLRANYPFGRSWAIERPILMKSPHFRPNLSLGPIHVHPRVLCEN